MKVSTLSGFIGEALAFLAAAFTRSPPQQTDLDDDLVAAVSVGNHDLATRLLTEGAYAGAMNANGQNCLQIATIKGDRQMQNLLTTQS